MLYLIISQTALAFVIVVGGACLMPRRPVPAAVVLAAVWSLLSGVMHVLLHPNPHFRDYLTVAVATLGAVAGVLAVHFRERSRVNEHSGDPAP